MQSAILTGIGIIGWFLKHTLDATNKRMDTIEGKLGEKVERLEKEMTDLKADLPFIYVTREDYIDAMNNVDDKLDKIYDYLLGKGGAK